MVNDCLGLYSQVIKCMWWMPWQSEAMKDVIACEKLRGGGKYPVIRRFLNGEPTHYKVGIMQHEYIGVARRTRGSETSQYP